MPYNQQAVNAVTQSLERFGITNKYVQAAVLATIAKESGFVPKPEVGYGNTSNARIRSIFGARVASLSDAQLDSLKRNDVAFFDHVYGGRYGNSAPGDGYKYRGRGFNQITFKDNYRHYGNKIGVDLVSNPDRLNDPETAAKAAAAYFADSLSAAERSGKLKEKIGVDRLADIKDTTTATRTAVQANAGWGTSMASSFMQENLRKALAVVDSFMTTAIRNPGKIIVGGLIMTALAVGIALLIVNRKKVQNAIS
jgi:predicted chitinase